MNAIKLNAGHDRNGNPRRCYVIMDDKKIIDVIDEGYRGHLSIKEYTGLNVVATFDTSPAQYRALLKEYKGGK